MAEAAPILAAPLAARLEEPPTPIGTGLGTWAARLSCAPKPKGNSKSIMPIGKRCPKCKKAGRHVLVPRKQDVQAEVAFTKLLRSVAPPSPFARDVALALTVVLPIRPSWSKEKQAAALAGTHRPTSNKGATGPIPDLGNLEKLLDDALEKGGWVVNDSQIAVRLRSRKIYGVEPGYVVEVLELPTWTP